MDSFKNWLHKEEKVEGCTDTGQIAIFARPTIPGYVGRTFADIFDERKKKKNGKNLSVLPTL